MFRSQLKEAETLRIFFDFKYEENLKEDNFYLNEIDFQKLN